MMSKKLAALVTLVGQFAISDTWAGVAGQNSTDSVHLPVRVELNSTFVLEVESDVATIVMANPEFADIKPVTKRRFFLFGRKLGRTSLLMTDADGKPIRDASLYVSMPSEGIVTVTRGAGKESHLSCDPRCSPSDIAKNSPAPSGGGGGGGGGGGDLTTDGTAPPPPAPPVAPPVTP